MRVESERLGGGRRGCGFGGWWRSHSQGQGCLDMNWFGAWRKRIDLYYTYSIVCQCGESVCLPANNSVLVSVWEGMMMMIVARML